MPISSNPNEIVDDKILSLLGLEDRVDIPADEYYQLLQERIQKSAFGVDKLSQEDLAILSNEKKRVREQKDTKEKLKIKKTKITAESFGVKKPEDFVPKALLGGTGVSAIIKRPESSLYKQETLKKDESKSLENSLVTIKDSLNSILESLTNQNKTKQKDAEFERKKKEREKRDTAESKLEKRFDTLKKIASKIIAPVKGILDKIINFFVQIFLGRVVIKLLEWLADPQNANKIKSILRFIGDWWPALLGSYILFGTTFGRFIRGTVGLLSRFIFQIGKVAIPRLLGLIAKNPLAALVVGTSVAGTLARTGEREKLKPELEKQRESVKKTEEDKNAPWYQKLGGFFAKQELTVGQQNQSIVAPVPGAMFSGGGLAGGFVSGEKGVDKVPAMLSDGEFVMSRGAVQMYGADTLAAMNAAGGGTNKPKVMSGTTYAAGGGYIGDYMKDKVKMRPATINEMTGENANLRKLLGVKSKEEAAKIVSAAGNQVPDVRDLLGDKEFSRFQQGQFSKFSEGADEKTFKGLQRIYQQHFGVGKEFEKMMSSRVDSRMLDRRTTTSTRPKPKVTRIDPSRMLPSAGQSSANAMRAAAKAAQNVRAPIPASSAIVPYTGGGLARTGVTGGLSVPQIRTNMRVPGGFGNLKSLGVELLLSYLVQSGLDYLEAKRLASTIEKARKESPEKLANRVEKLRELVDKEERFQKSFGGVLQKVIAMGGETGSEVLSRQAKTILAGVGAKTFQGGAIKGGYGLKQQSFKDMPKTQIMTDDKGRPFVGYKAMRGGKPVYVRGPQAGTGTTNPLEALGRIINPTGYKQNDQRISMQKQKIAMVDALENFQKRRMSSDAQARMMKQMGGNLKDVQNDLNYRKKTKANVAKPTPTTKVPIKPPAKPKPKVTVVKLNQYRGGQRGGGAKPATQSTPKFSAQHKSGATKSASAYGIHR